uniref:Pre-rRNA-processing protein Ipi1 N-terminal domain-containing protein n=1 Tax=Romanomermis culicivorax TaxID=13658 RepID=A0A915J9Y3_ROMCU
MAKSKKNADFKKVKLKIGKKLNKPNDTRTDFKAKKLVLIGQLNKTIISGKEDREEEYLSYRKLNVKELCQHLRHHNVNVRKDALTSIKDMITRQNTDQIRSNLKLLLENLSILMTDLDGDIRNLLFNILSDIFGKVRPTDVSPSFQLLTAHVNCASTHFNSAVRLFSVKILGLLLNKLPKLCQGNTKLLRSFADFLNFKERNFTRQIKSTILAILERILSINYSLESVMQEQTLEINNYKSVSVECAVINPKSCSLTRKVGNPFNFSIYSTHFSNNDHTDDTTIDLPNFYHAIEKALPFCHAFWLELTTEDSDNQNQESEPKSFDIKTLSDLKLILSTYQVVIDRLRKIDDDSTGDLNRENLSNNINNRYFDNDKFLNRYVQIFPCHHKRNAGEDQKKASELCRMINATLCKLLSGRKEYKEKICDYIAKLKSKKHINAHFLTELESFL